MSPPTRRALLASAAATATATLLAGCSSETTVSSNSNERPANADLDPEMTVLRHDAETPPIWYSETETPVDPATAERGVYETRKLVATPEDRDRLSFVDVEGADAARQFAAETDFERETLYLENRTVGACFRLELCYVTWSETEIDTDYGRHYRDADVACELGDEDGVARLIRIPDALDPGSVRGYGSGTSSSGCRLPPWARESADEGTEASR